MKIRSRYSKKNGTTISFTSEGGKDGGVLLDLIRGLAKPTPPEGAVKVVSGTGSVVERPEDSKPCASS